MYTAPKEQKFTVLCKVLFLTHHTHLNILVSPPRPPLRVLNSASPKGIFHTVGFHFLSILTNVVHFIVLQFKKKKNYSIIVYLTNCGLISFHGSLLYTSAMVCTDWTPARSEGGQSVLRDPSLFVLLFITVDLPKAGVQQVIH